MCKRRAPGREEGALVEGAHAREAAGRPLALIAQWGPVSQDQGPDGGDSGLWPPVGVRVQAKGLPQSCGHRRLWRAHGSLG